MSGSRTPFGRQYFWQQVVRLFKFASSAQREHAREMSPRIVAADYDNEDGDEDEDEDDTLARTANRFQEERGLSSL